MELAALDDRVVDHTVTARRSLAPSSTTRIGRVTSKPRSRSPVSTSVTTVVFSVAPAAKASGSWCRRW